MSDLAKTARAANRNKAQRLTANETDARSVDASSWTPCEPLKADEQTGPKPIGRQARKAGGRVEGCSTTPRADMKPRKGPKREHRDMGGMDSSVPTSRFDFAPSGPGKLASVMGMKKDGGAVESRRKRDAGGALSVVSPAYALATDPKKLKAISPVANLFKRGGTAKKRAHKMDGGDVLKAGMFGIPAAALSLVKGDKDAPAAKNRGGKASSVSDGELEGTRPTGGRMARKDGGRASKGKMNVNIIIDTGKDQNAGPAPGGPPMPHPPMPMPVPQPPVVGPPPAMGGGMPPMPGGPSPIPPGLAAAMPRKRGGRAMNAGAGSGEGRLEKTARC